MGLERQREVQSIAAPEIDVAAQALEYYPRVFDGLQVSFVIGSFKDDEDNLRVTWRQVQNGVGPELFRSTEPGIVINEQGLPEVLQMEAKGAKNTIQSRVLRLTIFSIAVLIVVILGVGLGIGLKEKQVINNGNGGSSGSTPSSNSTSTSNATSSSNHTTPVLARGIINDTSLTSVMTLDGNRHVFLQDINGTLRHAVFSSVANL